ncbi:MAG: hypothetical protein K0S76_2073 [Herbinix sp.]|jgi:transcriptional regulator with XRE-family HTH domain|nr:hypothetical protein [Herbinix sp.]
MDLNENIRNNVQRLRKERNVTQDVLAAALEISVQAVSKWETGTSLPDIMQLPRIARFFGVTIDYLFFSEGKELNIINGELPEDDILRIIQFKGNRMLAADEWEKDKSIELKIPDAISESNSNINLNVEIRGNANIKGNINGYTECEGSVNCGNIGSYVECGDRVNCGNIGGYVEAEGSVNCGNIGGYVESGDRVNCGNIGGNVESGSSINCGDINGNVECGGDLSCGIIKSPVECKGDIHCKEIHGDVSCEGNIIYEK